MSFLTEKSKSILMIILGIIALIFPLISTEAIGFISGMMFILIGVSFIISGIAELIITKYFGLIYLIMGILSIIAAYYLIFDPAFVSGLIGLIIYIFGLMLIIIGIFGDKFIFMELFGYRLCFIIEYICLTFSILQTIYLMLLESKGIYDAIIKYRPILLLV